MYANALPMIDNVLSFCPYKYEFNYSELEVELASFLQISQLKLIICTSIDLASKFHLCVISLTITRTGLGNRVGPRLCE